MNLREALEKVKHAGYNPVVNEEIEYINPEDNYGNPFLDKYGDIDIDALKAAEPKSMSAEDKKYWVEAYQQALAEFPDDPELNDMRDVMEWLSAEVETPVDESYIAEGNVKKTIEKLEDGSEEEMVSYFEELADETDEKMRKK